MRHDLYRILIDDLNPGYRFLMSLYRYDEDMAQALGSPNAFGELQRQWGAEARRRLVGAGIFGFTMNHFGLDAPRLTHPRARFYFTGLGWAEVGRHVAAAARRDGHLVKIIRRKEPARSQVVFRDPLQVAILPRR